MESIRARVNRDLIKFVTSTGNKAIKHPDFQDKNPGLFSDDTHPSFIGMDILLNTFKEALELFITNSELSVFPSTV